MFTLLDEQKARKFWEEELREEGREEGENRLGSLMASLMNKGRNSDALRAATDEKYRQQLYQELQIQ